MDTSSEEWRRLCWARFVARMPIEQRLDWLADLERPRKGGSVELRLEHEVEVLLALPDKDSRYVHLAAVEATEGQGRDRRAELERRVMETWRQRKARAAAHPPMGPPAAGPRTGNSPLDVSLVAGPGKSPNISPNQGLFNGR